MDDRGNVEKSPFCVKKNERFQHFIFHNLACRRSCPISAMPFSQVTEMTNLKMLHAATLRLMGLPHTTSAQKRGAKKITKFAVKQFINIVDRGGGSRKTQKYVDIIYGSSMMMIGAHAQKKRMLDNG